ncbi:transmembrane protein, putative (macronuclear) [Tetrahymena thermophila SB210]|uniref:Transmembrane protein, putative n=1 Tax=Tetrahymena thermophila (strain SB210) TaxID=312017 RepID=I7M6Z5_TETTS|nr:transmembrane protein, putative [Tetrahymena thermophila SB210]EAR87540.2 transmembrane protein, putative [Tetrahymena thermophila SB210]|eukprot:XP_001007785.2 transmembrane protein, putative [Tetrahymena thermophila SB210]
MHNFQSDNNKQRNYELKEVLINKNQDPSSEIQNLGNQWNIKFNQIQKYLKSLDLKVPELELRGSDEQFRKNIKDEIQICAAESKILGKLYERLVQITVNSQSDKNLKEIHMAQQRQQLEQFQTKFKIIAEKYANIEQRNQKLNKFQEHRFEQGVDAEPTSERQRLRINEQRHEQEMLEARARDLQEVLQNLSQAVSMIQDLDNKVAEQGIQIENMVAVVQDTQYQTEETAKIMEDTKKLTNSTTNTTLQLCLLVTVIVVILILMISSGGSKSSSSNNNNNKLRF